jgi:hypothetical protein
MDINRRCCVQCDAGGAASLDEHRAEWILWPQTDGTSRTIEADAIRAIVAYIEQRDGVIAR